MSERIPPAARADDAEFLLQTGASAQEAAKRLGLSLKSCGVIMRRAGRPDLARVFEAEVNRQRPGGQCIVCGKATGWQKKSDACPGRHSAMKRHKRGPWAVAA